MSRRKEGGCGVGMLIGGGGVGMGRGGRVSLQFPGHSAAAIIWRKKNLLLSVCKGNENLMRLDFFFSSLSVHSHSSLCSTTASLRRNAGCQKWLGLSAQSVLMDR